MPSALQSHLRRPAAAYPIRSQLGCLLKTSPSATIGGNSNCDNTGLDSPTGVTVDSSGNIYVTNAGNGPDSLGSITVYSAGSSGNVPPIATISDDPGCAPCDKTELSLPVGISLDSRGNIYVANAAGWADGLGSVTEYAPLGRLAAS